MFRSISIGLFHPVRWTCWGRELQSFFFFKIRWKTLQFTREHPQMSRIPPPTTESEHENLLHEKAEPNSHKKQHSGSQASKLALGGILYISQKHTKKQVVSATEEKETRRTSRAEQRKEVQRRPTAARREDELKNQFQIHAKNFQSARTNLHGNQPPRNSGTSSTAKRRRTFFPRYFLFSPRSSQQRQTHEMKFHSRI